MNTSWYGIIAINGKKHAGFEEMCSQIAQGFSEKSEKYQRFFRTGAPNASLLPSLFLDKLQSYTRYSFASKRTEFNIICI